MKLLTILAGAATVSAHGFVQTITAGGRVYDNYNPTTFPYMPNPPPAPGWNAQQLDLGFVEPNAAGSADIICHKSATPGRSSVPVRAGETITLQWSPWPDSHKGPVIDYLADCGGSCSNANKQNLRWFKIAEKGLNGGSWAAIELLNNGNKWQVKIPDSIAPGNYVLRHEIIALHSAGNANGAQFYPQCINLQVTGGGSARPGGIPGTSLYRANDPGVLFNIYNNPTSYPIPGPALWRG